MSDSTRMSAVNSDLSSNLEERMQSPQALHGQQDGKPFKLNKYTEQRNKGTTKSESEFIKTITSYSCVNFFLWGLFLCTQVLLSTLLF